MAKPKNGKAKRKHQEQVQAVPQVQAKSSTRFNRWTFGVLALLFVLCTGFAVSSSRAVQADRVNNQARSIDDEDVDPQTWRDLKLVMTTADGGKTEMGLLRPTWWIEQVGAAEGKTINLNIPEMKMAGPTKVLSITRMEGDKVGGAGTVTGTFKHTASDILNLQLQGEKAPIGVTPTHPFRSADRNAWVSVGQLKVGERVVTRNGTTKVVSISRRAGSEPVYNLEVHKTHTYFVGTTGGGTWVHNSCVRPDVENLSTKITNSMNKPNRMWTKEQILEAYEHGDAFPAIDMTAGGAPATRFVHPTTGKFVVINNETGNIVQVGGEGFLPSHG